MTETIRIPLAGPKGGYDHIARATRDGDRVELSIYTTQRRMTDKFHLTATGAALLAGLLLEITNDE